jgi:predicted amidohydrolase YtcJ
MIYFFLARTQGCLFKKDGLATGYQPKRSFRYFLKNTFSRNNPSYLLYSSLLTFTGRVQKRKNVALHYMPGAENNYFYRINKTMRTLLFILAVFVLAINSAAQQPDIILYNGKIFTADKNQLYAEAIAITGNKISAVGNNAAIEKLAGSTTKKINLKGRTVVPGFNDAHSHAGAHFPSRRFEFTKNPTDPTPWETIKDSIQKIVKEIPVGMMIRTEINPDVLEDSRARRKNLDSIAPNNPVILSAWTGHGKICNSAALQLLGFDEHTSFAAGKLHKDEAGRLNGIIDEYACYIVNSKLVENLSLEDIVKDLKVYYQEILSLGITSNQVMATQMSAEKFRDVFTQNDFGVRNRIIAFPMTNSSGLDVQPWTKLFHPLNKKNEVSGIKLILDGTPIERLAAVSASYSDKPGQFGLVNFSEPDIKAYIRLCLQYKQQIMVHAVGDSAIGTFIRCLRALHPDKFWKDKRVRLEHAELAVSTSDDLKTLQKMGIVIVQNPLHLGLPQVMAMRWNNRSPYLQAMRSLIDNNIPLAIGSDGPHNPFLNIMMATIHPDNPKESITVEKAVIAYTLGSAYAEFKEKQKGTLTVGKLADLAVLSQDIFSIPLQQLPATSSVLTMVDGKIVFEAP